MKRLLISHNKDISQFWNYKIFTKTFLLPVISHHHVWDMLDSQVRALGYFMLELIMDGIKSASEEARKSSVTGNKLTDPQILG